MTSLKCDSEPGGTLCLWLSLMTSRWLGANAVLILVSIRCCTLIFTPPVTPAIPINKKLL